MTLAASSRPSLTVDLFPVRGQAGLSCDYSPFGSGDARARIADGAPVTVGFTPHDNGGRFGNYTVEGDTYETGGVHSRQRDYYHAFADELFESMHDAGAIRISLPGKPGDLLLTFPLKGLANALEDAGFDTRRYTQYESTWHFGGGSVAKNVFWLHESDLAELANLRRDTLKVRVTFAVRSADGSTRPGD